MQIGSTSFVRGFSYIFSLLNGKLLLNSSLVLSFFYMTALVLFIRLFSFFWDHVNLADITPCYDISKLKRFIQFIRCFSLQFMGSAWKVVVGKHSVLSLIFCIVPFYQAFLQRVSVNMMVLVSETYTAIV